MATARTVTLTYTSLYKDGAPDDKVQNTELKFIIAELFASGSLSDVSVTVSNVKKDVNPDDVVTDTQAVNDIDDAVAAIMTMAMTQMIGAV